jgi:phosphohistidine phosphatase
MLIYVVRHAIAVTHGTPGIAEPDRPLTPQGIRKMRRNVQALACLKVRLDEILTSPLPRARQTADLLAAGLKFTKPIREVDDLRPEADFSLLGRELSHLSSKKAVALVGHEPNLGYLTTWLLTGSKTSAIAYKKGGIACIRGDQFDPPSGNQLLWLLTPKQMARLAKT